MYVCVHIRCTELNRVLLAFCLCSVLCISSPSFVAIHLLIGHILLVLFLSTYLRLIFGKHKKVPEQFNLSPEVVDKVYLEGVSEVDSTSIIMCVYMCVCMHMV